MPYELRFISPYDSLGAGCPAELVVIEDWMLPAEMIFNRISYSNLSLISQFDDPVKRSFYEIENIKSCWSNRELDRQISSSYGNSAAK